MRQISIFIFVSSLKNFLVKTGFDLIVKFNDDVMFLLMLPNNHIYLNQNLLIIKNLKI